MSAAGDIRPFLEAADRERPDLKQINTQQSCFELLKLTLQKAGPDWAFIGKTRTMDGASVTPFNFQPITMLLIRPDGEKQSVEIVGVGMDACWHIPSHRQVKVIANSSANDDPDPAIHGSAKLTPYDIEPQYYRWHNPPIAQGLVSGDAAPWTPSVPVPPPVVLTNMAAYPGDDVFDKVADVLFADYSATGQSPNPQMGRWFGRTIYDWLAKNEPTLDASIAKHKKEWRALLGLPS